MDFKRIFKTPLFWVLAVIVVMLTVFTRRSRPPRPRS
jgi:hypothetical protein